MISHVIVEGIDRLGKDTLIKGIQDQLGYHQVLHFQKPIILDKYMREAVTEGIRDPEDVKRAALKKYQWNSFSTMFKMMKGQGPIICNRAHLGETVYAKRYRGYDGNYVFDIEKMFSYVEGPIENVLLVVLHTSDFRFISDDGQSFDVSKREEEQADFINAYDRSMIPNKMLIDVNDGHGKFVAPNLIVDAVCKRLK